MNVSFETLDWSHIRSFLAVAEAGSLSAAAKAGGASQPSLGRHIKALETTLGAELFLRDGSGFTLTDAGRVLLEPARDMAQAAARLGNLATGQETGLAGTVRITASVVVSHFLMPRIIAGLRDDLPEIEIELVPSDAPENLIYREADIALRMFRPTQLDIVTRQIAEQSMALYGAHALLDQFSPLRGFEDLAALPFVGFDRSDLMLRQMRDLGVPVDRHFFGTRCDDQAAFWQLVCAGCGIGAMQCAVGDAEPRVRRLDIQPQLASLPVWLAAQEDVYKNARVKRVWDGIAAGFQRPDNTA